MRSDKGRWSNWGLFPEITGSVHRPTSKAELERFIHGTFNGIPRGNGRCYGDASLASHMLSAMDLPPLLELNAERGTLRCGAGVLLSQVLEHIVPQGFFLPVTPGTRFITVGGAIAADVHGKNHHKDGAFSAFVDALTLITGDGSTIICGPEKESDLFHATCGGMGLTGMIVEATFRLKRITSSYIRQKSERCGGLDELLQRFQGTMDTTYSVAWIDLMSGGGKQGRSVLLLGEHADRDELRGNARKKPLRVHPSGMVNVPIHFPSFVLGPWSIRSFNTAFYHKPSSAGDAIVHYSPYFYPLDAVNNWNRIYGRRGFLQYQFALPLSAGPEGVRSLVNSIQRERIGSFLSVLKMFGPGDARKPLSFPIEGYTLALDIAVHPRVFGILNALDDRVAEMGGRIYLAKDARMDPEMLRATYPKLDEFKRTVHKYGGGRFHSIQSERLHISENAMTTSFDPQRALVLGATSDIAAAIARVLAEKGYSLTLAARNTDAVRTLADELRLKTEVDVVRFDAIETQDHPSFYNALTPKPGVVVCAFGHLPDPVNAEADGREVERTIRVNFTGAATILEEAARDLEQRGTGTIVGISSVAGERGRASNYHYGSAKAGFTAYLSGLRNRLNKSGVHVLTVKPGFVRTRMTEGLPLPAPLTAQPEQVANSVVNAIKKKKNVIYTLPIWWLVMAVIRNIPEGIFKRMKL